MNEKLSFTHSLTYEILTDDRGGWYVREHVHGRGGFVEYGPCASLVAARELRDSCAAAQKRGAEAAFEHIRSQLFKNVWPSGH